MATNFHESYSQSGIRPPSERTTGLVLALVAVVIGVWWRNIVMVTWLAFGVAVALAALSWLAPKVLKHLNLIWFRLGLLLHRVVNPVVMLVLFVVVFVPAGLIMRFWYDPLRSRREGPGGTYWIDRTTSAPGTASMTNQF
jgi:hypothetical protein